VTDVHFSRVDSKVSSPTLGVRGITGPRVRTRTTNAGGTDQGSKGYVVVLDILNSGYSFASYIHWTFRQTFHSHSFRLTFVDMGAVLCAVDIVVVSLSLSHPRCLGVVISNWAIK